MKKTIILAAGIFFSLNSLIAQSNSEDIDIVQAAWGKNKKELVSQYMQVPAKDSIAFWKLYDEYTAETKKNAKQRVKLYERTAEAYSNMTATTADSLAGNFFKQRAEQEKLIEAYYKKIKTATSPIVAFQFYQGEVYLLTQLRSQIMQQIPTYGQLLNAIKK